jgi:hypothetical protein
MCRASTHDAAVARRAHADQPLALVGCPFRGAGQRGHGSPQASFCPPSYGAPRVKPLDLAWAGLALSSGGARSHTQRSAPPRSIGAWTGFRRRLQLTASPHIRSGAKPGTHIPHACGEEAMRMGPIYKSAVVSAQGWHGHHPSRADRGSVAALPRRLMIKPSSRLLPERGRW